MKNIYVTQPSLPPLAEFIPYLEKIWDSHILTNNGQFHKQLERELCEYLGVKHVSLFCNATIALITALQALEISGEVITTPFSFVATANSLMWNGITPVFADIDEHTFNMDPSKVEALITSETAGIMPVHVYGNPCDVRELQRIADRYGLKLIYDAAHAFGVKLDGESILNHGDLSVISFHATKTFTTFEGGAIVCDDEQTKKKIDNLKNFGFTGETSVIASGINGKMNEFQAAFGLLYLKYIDAYILKRKEVTYLYRERLRGVEGLRMLHEMPGVMHNYSYFPVLIDQDAYGRSRDDVYDSLKKEGFYTRRYFYPLISQFPPYQGLESSDKGKLPVAEKIAQQVLCLPIYPDLKEDEIESVIKTLCGRYIN